MSSHKPVFIPVSGRTASKRTSQHAERGKDVTKATLQRRFVPFWDRSKRLAQVGKACWPCCRSLFELVGLCVAEHIFHDEINSLERGSVLPIAVDKVVSERVEEQVRARLAR